MDREVTLRPPRYASAEGYAARRERRVRLVAALTGITMAIEFAVGAITRSLALTADAWHMASHTGVLGFSALAYWYARSRADRDHFTFGTGKVHALAGYTNAIVLLVGAALIAASAARRLLQAEAIDFGEALPVAMVGLAANVASILLLGDDRHPHEEADHDGAHHHRDHNFRAAYLHVLSDTLTGVLAIASLCAGRYLGLGVLDPIAAVVGGLAMAWWGFGLLRSSARQLLDAVPLPGIRETIRDRLEALGGVDVTDVRVWQTGPGQLACIVRVVGGGPAEIDGYRAAVLDAAPVAHLAVEVLPRDA
ncbi:MAG: CDF family Co(II)/Ni(II) efflux transporter DmeF [Myxococcales bacterium]|nr:CDF family Co(II)/Ni(II) efflux transporter DmeF [Myxococcales bacterium]